MRSPHRLLLRDIRGGVSVRRRSFPSAASIADEVIGGRRMAEFGPSFRAPIFDEAGFADVLLEPLGLADGRVGRMPKSRKVYGGRPTDLEIALMPIKHAIGGADVQIDEI